MFKKKNTKTAKKSARKSTKTQTGKPSSQAESKQDTSDRILAKLMAIEKEARLEQARDRVDQLEDQEIAESIEQLLKLLGPGE